MIILIIFGLSVSIYTTPANIQRNYNGYIYSGKAGDKRIVNIKLYGKLYKNVIHNHRFVGTLEVDDAKVDVFLTYDMDNEQFFGGLNNEFKSIVIGTKRDFSSMFLRTYDTKDKEELKILAPASNNEEAKIIIGLFALTW